GAHAVAIGDRVLLFVVGSAAARQEHQGGAAGKQDMGESAAHMDIGHEVSGWSGQPSFPRGECKASQKKRGWGSLPTLYLVQMRSRLESDLGTEDHEGALVVGTNGSAISFEEADF